jgi:uncharacterized membrane protein
MWLKSGRLQKMNQGKPKIKTSDRAAHAYARFRGSPYFVASMLLLIALWLGVHFWIGSDKDFGALNLILSSEATLSTALLIMDLAKGDADRKRSEQRHTEQLKYMQHLLEAILEDTEDLENKT